MNPATTPLPRSELCVLCECVCTCVCVCECGVYVCMCQWVCNFLLPLIELIHSLLASNRQLSNREIRCLDYTSNKTDVGMEKLNRNKNWNGGYLYHPILHSMHTIQHKLSAIPILFFFHPYIYNKFNAQACSL